MHSLPCQYYITLSPTRLSTLDTRRETRTNAGTLADMNAALVNPIRHWRRPIRAMTEDVQCRVYGNTIRSSMNDSTASSFIERSDCR